MCQRQCITQLGLQPLKMNKILGLVLIIIGLFIVLSVASGPVLAGSTLAIVDVIVGILVLVGGIYLFKR